MFQADDLYLAYSGQPILEGVSFTLQKGERCGLIGRNGSGKSTLFRLIDGEEEPDRGRFVFPRNYRIGVLEQQIRFTQSTILEEGALGLREDDQMSLYKVERILFGLGFNEEMLELSPDQLSGGYRLRVQLAKVLVSEPDCLLLDEPTNYLDILSIRFLTKFLQEWEGEMILISHDLQFLDETTTHMMGLHRHKIYKIKGKSSDLFHLIAEEEATHQNTLQQMEKKKAHLQSFIDRFGAKATKAGQAQSRKKMLERMPDLEQLKSLYQLDFSFHEKPFMGKKMIDASHVGFSYDSSTTLIEDFSLEIHKGERIAIIGKNGYGKSTLLRLLAQELSSNQGSVSASPALALGYFGQTSIERLDQRLTIEAEIASANHNLNFSQIRAICGLMMFSGDLAKKPISVLSGGEKSRVLLGKIVAQPCNLLLLDEPTHHLDIESIEALIDAIEEFSGAVVLITHSEWMLRRIPFDKLVVCHKQKQDLFLGTYDEFLASGGWLEEQPEPKKKAEPPPKPKSARSEIKSCEDQIVRLEASLSKHQTELDKMTKERRFDEAAALVVKISEEQHAIDELFLRLEKLHSR